MPRTEPRTFKWTTRGDLNTRKTRQNQRGSLQILFALISIIVATGFLSIWGILKRWHTLMLRQLRLNQCVGVEMQNLAKTLNEIDQENLRIRDCRDQSLKAPNDTNCAESLTSSIATQELALARWNSRVEKWKTPNDCLSLGDEASPLPNLPLSRKPPDELGPQELEWFGDLTKPLKVQVIHPPRAAAAEVILKGDRWHPRWAEPSGQALLETCLWILLNLVLCCAFTQGIQKEWKSYHSDLHKKSGASYNSKLDKKRSYSDPSPSF